MHGNGVLVLELSSQSQQRGENECCVFRTSKASSKECGTSTQGPQVEEFIDAQNLELPQQFGADNSSSDEERSPLWTRPAHMRNGGAKVAASPLDLESGLGQKVAVQQLAANVLDKGQPVGGSPLARITLTGDSKVDQPHVKIAGGGLLKVRVSEDCELTHHFEIESYSGGKVFETPFIAPGSVFTWRPPGPGKYSCTDLLYPWIKSRITVLPTLDCSVSPASDASESQPSTPDGPLSAAEPPISVKDLVHGLVADSSIAESRAGTGTVEKTASSSERREGPSANGLVTQTVEVDGGLGRFGVVARTSIPARGAVCQKETLPEQEAVALDCGGNEVDDLLRVPLLAKKPTTRTGAKKQHSDGHTWNESWEDSSGDERGAPGCRLRRRAKEERGGTEKDESTGADTGSQMRQIINPGEIDEWVERISREEEESRNAKSHEPDTAAAATSVENEQTGSAEAEGVEMKKGGKAAKKKKKKTVKRGGADGSPASADGGAAETPSEDHGSPFDDPMIGINRVLSSIPSTTGITHYDVSGAGMAKGGRPAKLMAIGRTPDGKMEVSPISPMMSPSSLMKGGLSNSKFAERSPLMEEDSHSYRRLGELIDMEPGLGYMDEPRLREIKNFGGGLPPHMGGFAMRDGGQGWSLGAPPHMAAIVPELPCRLKTCPKKFVSSVSMLRHYLQRHKKQGGDLVAERPAMMAFWADLSKEEQRELLAIKDFEMQGVSGNQVSAELVQKARFRKLHGIKGAKYMTLGTTILNMVFSPLGLPPTSSVDLFNALDEASEHTFLRGRTDPAVQRFVTADPARGMGDEGYLVGMLALMLEDRIVTAWMKSKEEGTLKSYQALIKEEEAALKKKEKAQQKKDRKKQKKTADQPTPADAFGETDFGSADRGATEAFPVEEPTELPETASPRAAAVHAALMNEFAELIEEKAVGIEGAASESDEQSVDTEAERASAGTEPSLVQDGDREADLGSRSTSGESETSPDAETGPDVEEEAQAERESKAGLGPSRPEVSTTAAASASQSGFTEAPVEGPVLPPSPQASIIAVAEVSSTRPFVHTDAKPGSRLRDTRSSPLQKTIAVPVSRMGGKVKVGDPSKGLQTLSTARPTLTEPVVLVVTKMGPKVRDGGKGALEASAKASGGSGTLTKQVSGGSSRARSEEEGKKGPEIVITGRGSAELPQQSPTREELPNSSEDIGSAAISLKVPETIETFHGEAGLEGSVQGAVQPVGMEMESEALDGADVGTPAASQRAQHTGRGISNEPGPETDRESSGRHAEAAVSKPDNESTPVASNTGDRVLLDGDSGAELQRKQSGGSEGRDGVKQGRKARKPRGKKRGAARSKERGDGTGGADGVSAGGATEWDEKATQELKLLLMGTENGATVEWGAGAVANSASPVGFGSGLRPVDSQAVDDAGMEGEASSVPPVDSSEIPGSGSRWVGRDAAVIQQEAAREHLAETASVEREGADERQSESEAPVEAWPELGSDSMRVPLTGRRKQGRRGEKDATAGLFGRGAKSGTVDASQRIEGPAAQSGGLEVTTTTLPREADSAPVVGRTSGVSLDGQTVGGTSLEGGVMTEGAPKALGSVLGKASGAEGREATWVAVGVTSGGRGRQERTGMGLQEIMAFFAARWQAAVKDAGAINLSHVEPVQSSDAGVAEAGTPALDVEALEASGWGDPTPNQSVTASKQDRTARKAPLEHADPGGQVRSAAGDSVTEPSKDRGGWQEARTRKGGEGRGRGRESKNTAVAGAHLNTHDVRKSRKPSR